MFAKTPKPPYYGVIFTTERAADKTERSAYLVMASQMLDLAAEQPGYLGVETVSNELGEGITVSYWQSLAAIQSWRDNADHKIAQELGNTLWYKRYALRVAKVEKAYEFNNLTQDAF